MLLKRMREIAQRLRETGQDRPDDKESKALHGELDEICRDAVQNGERKIQRLRQVLNQQGEDYLRKEERRIVEGLVRKRKALKVTQVSIAKKIGSPKSVVSRLESSKNKHSLSLNTLIRYADALGYRLRIKLTPKCK